MITIKDENFHTIKDLCEKFKVTAQTIRKWLIIYKIDYKKIGKLNYVPESELFKLFTDKKFIK
jgi:DeoR/GlpR family transcriptional regulator of sugar metabolism